MTPFVSDPDFTLYVGDALEVLRELSDESVHCCVTSPPYWGLRDYGTGAWDGGDPDCDHLRQSDVSRASSGLDGATTTQGGVYAWKDVCGKCGATRVDHQLGLEPTPDEFVAAIVQVFREVRRVLRSDGTLWLNLGDSYAATTKGSGGLNSTTIGSGRGQGTNAGSLHDDRAWQIPPGLKPKDLVGIPWRVAFALQADGWYLRSDIVWSKPNPMPESVTDRPTKAHEYVFLLSKSPRYFFDQEAVREPVSPWSDFGNAIPSVPFASTSGDDVNDRRIHARLGNGSVGSPFGRNLRSVWEIATQPYPQAHFATFPEALPDRCIRAGTSERGCCPECGAAWTRATDVAYEKSTVHGTGSVVGRHDVTGANNYDGAGMPRLNKIVTTTGWAPSCDHYETYFASPDVAQPPVGPVVPCTVLDPFMGSGTTALVARKLGRRSIGIELSPEYAALCADRLKQLSLFATEASA